MAVGRLQLTRYGLENVNYQWLGACRLRVDAADPSGSGADPNIFLFLRHPPDPYNGDVHDVFIGVASPVDMSTYPAGAPDGVTTYPMFRDASFELDFPAVSLADRAWTIVVHDANRLLEALERLTRLVPVETVWAGSTPPDSPSDSSDSSTSSLSV